MNYKKHLRDCLGGVKLVSCPLDNLNEKFLTWLNNPVITLSNALIALIVFIGAAVSLIQWNGCKVINKRIKAPMVDNSLWTAMLVFWGISSALESVRYNLNLPYRIRTRQYHADDDTQLISTLLTDLSLYFYILALNYHLKYKCISTIQLLKASKKDNSTTSYTFNLYNTKDQPISLPKNSNGASRNLMVRMWQNLSTLIWTVEGCSFLLLLIHFIALYLNVTLREIWYPFFRIFIATHILKAVPVVYLSIRIIFFTDKKTNVLHQYHDPLHPIQTSSEERLVNTPPETFARTPHQLSNTTSSSASASVSSLNTMIHTNPATLRSTNKNIEADPSTSQNDQETTPLLPQSCSSHLQSRPQSLPIHISPTPKILTRLTMAVAACSFILCKFALPPTLWHFFLVQLAFPPTCSILNGTCTYLDIGFLVQIFGLLLQLLFIRTEYKRCREICRWLTMSQIQQTFVHDAILT